MSLQWESESLRSRHGRYTLDVDQRRFTVIEITAILYPHFHLQEYVEYYGGPGVQHIAMNTSDIITAVKSKKKNLFVFVCGCIPKAAVQLR